MGSLTGPAAGKWGPRRTSCRFTDPVLQATLIFAAGHSLKASQQSCPKTAPASPLPGWSQALEEEEEEEGGEEEEEEARPVLGLKGMVQRYHCSSFLWGCKRVQLQAL